MAKKLAHPESNQYVREASQALRHHNLPGGFRDRIDREDGVELVSIRNSAPIELTNFDVVGHWTLTIAWTLRRDPAGGLILWRSSVGLNVRDVEFAPDEPVCLVRYDIDKGRPGPNLAALGAHINVFQPEPLRDRLHFPVLAGDDRVWGVREVIDVFLAPEFISDLRRCVGGP